VFSVVKGRHERSSRRRLMTAVLGLALAVPILVVATGFDRPASAADVNVTVRIQEVRENPCQAGDLIQLNGILHVLVSTTANGSGGFQVFTSSNTQGLTGTSLVTGERYVASDEVQDRSSFPAGPPFPVTQTVVQSHELVSQGTSPNWVMHWTLRVRVDALGVPTVLVDNMHAECEG
jgi:hypothetical protein